MRSCRGYDVSDCEADVSRGCMAPGAGRTRQSAGGFRRRNQCKIIQGLTGGVRAVLAAVKQDYFWEDAEVRRALSGQGVALRVERGQWLAHSLLMILLRVLRPSASSP